MDAARFEFSWDATKAASNLAKHGVSFEEAATAFDDENGLDWADPRHSKAERRRKRLAESNVNRLLLIVGEETDKWQRNDPNHQCAGSIV